MIRLANTNAAATAPATVTVPAGASTKTFTINTSRVTSNRGGTVTATYGAVSKALTLTVRPLRVKTLALSPNPVRGGTTTNATVTLECAAPSGGLVVGLSSNRSATAAPTVSSIVIPAGATIGRFSVRTTAVTATTSATIRATTFGVAKDAALTVTR